MEENYIWPEITKETTLEEVREIHRRIWDYVIEHGEKPETPYPHNCVLCTYDDAISDGMLSDCRFCPARCMISWKCLGGLYNKWVYATGRDKKALAQKIRDIEFVSQKEMDVKITHLNMR